jgi:Bacterial dnaA protein helix-turn-helix
MTQLEVLHKPRPRRCKPPQRDAHGQVCWLTEEVVAATFAVPVAELRLPSRRSADVAFARQTAMYLAHVVFGLTHEKVGQLFRRDRTTARHACVLVEERRDNPAFDRVLQSLEGICIELSRGLKTPPQVRP